MQPELRQPLDVPLLLNVQLRSRRDESLTLVHRDHELQVLALLRHQPDRIHRFVDAGSNGNEPDEGPLLLHRNAQRDILVVHRVGSPVLVSQ